MIRVRFLLKPTSRLVDGGRRDFPILHIIVPINEQAVISFSFFTSLTTDPVSPK